MTEHLVVLSPNEQGAAASVRQSCRVVSALPPRLLVVEADEEAARNLRDLPGVDQVASGAAEILLNSLNEGERLFVEGWLQSRQSDKKQRPGDELNWGDEGFSPPDQPRNTPR